MAKNRDDDLKPMTGKLPTEQEETGGKHRKDEDELTDLSQYPPMPEAPSQKYL